MWCKPENKRKVGMKSSTKVEIIFCLLFGSVILNYGHVRLSNGGMILVAG